MSMLGSCAVKAAAAGLATPAPCDPCEAGHCCPSPCPPVLHATAHVDVPDGSCPDLDGATFDLTWNALNPSLCGSTGSYSGQVNLQAGVAFLTLGVYCCADGTWHYSLSAACTTPATCGCVSPNPSPVAGAACGPPVTITIPVGGCPCCTGCTFHFDITA